MFTVNANELDDLPDCVASVRIRNNIFEVTLKDNFDVERQLIQTATAGGVFPLPQTPSHRIP